MFEVSNVGRLKIMKTILIEKNSFSGIVRKLGITTQEISRHFSRLVDAVWRLEDPMAILN